MTRIRLSLVAAALILALPSGTYAQRPLDDLLKKIPSSANALMLIDVKRFHSSPLGVKEGWKQVHDAAYVNKPLMLPPESDWIVLASQMNPNRDFEEAWELAVISLTESMSMQSIAKSEGGYVDTIDGLQAAWTPSDAYFVSLSEKTLGVMYPAHRQAVSRWADFSKNNQAVALSPYLKEAAGRMPGTPQIVMAFDLNQAIQPHTLQEGLRENELTKDDPAKQRAWAGAIGGLRGVTLAVEIGQVAHGELHVDFTGSPALFGEDAKTVVLNVLNKYGAGIEEMETWKVNLDERAIVLEGDLTTPAMRKLFSLLELPTTKFSELKDRIPEPSENPNESPADSPDAITKASQQYFRSVSTLLDDIQNEFRTNRDARRNNSPVYIERYARRIDRLPILNVDEELLAYGATVGETMRGVSVTTRMSGVRAGARKSAVYGNYQYQYDNNGYYSARPSSSVRTQVKREEDAKALDVRFSSWKEVEDATAAIRKTMTAKYGVEF